jgi:hypothetical protein
MKMDINNFYRICKINGIFGFVHKTFGIKYSVRIYTGSNSFNTNHPVLDINQLSGWIQLYKIERPITILMVQDPQYLHPSCGVDVKAGI